ncbi:dihydrofolate reductase family protein [Clostridium ganghwense]|uniref:Dihydrofolate reductase family protein n=1 Tax=Clostridium ganghwense TaxID=312089 RepID=A0ABT4CPM0_9CLOT|nr:dihydrofolate reductase family protein [Clostridium ganghwense]MCY6370181.1 dihydrofolate reductase family protein [Clostridium ganghwense]
MSRKIILNLAISLDGYIADENGGYDWIKGDGDTSLNTEKVFSFPEFVDSVDTIVMGKNAYKDCGIENIEDFESKKFFVATSNNMDNYDNVEFISGDICSEIQKLQKEEGKDIWLFGGAGLTDSFIKADIVDEYIIGIIPIILGKGRPLFLGNNPTIKLHLDECTVQEGITILRYLKRVE